MLKIKPPDYKFCPFCGDWLKRKKIDAENFKHCSKDKWTYYPHVPQAANAIIIKDKKILLVQRNRDPHKGKWMFPAGFIDYGEHPKEAAIREVKEETGLNTKKAVFFGIFQTEDDPRAPGTLSFYYAVKADGKINNKDKAENSDIKWFELTDLPPIAWKDHRKILNKLKRESAKGSEH